MGKRRRRRSIAVFLVSQTVSLLKHLPPPLLTHTHTHIQTHINTYTHTTRFLLWCIEGEVDLRDILDRACGAQRRAGPLPTKNRQILNILYISETYRYTPDTLTFHWNIWDNSLKEPTCKVNLCYPLCSQGNYLWCELETLVSRVWKVKVNDKLNIADSDILEDNFLGPALIWIMNVSWRLCFGFFYNMKQ